jgi:membrane protein
MARSQNQGGRTREAVPNGPTDLSGGSWRVAAKRTLKEYKDDDLQDRASADKLRDAAPGRDK